MESLGLNAPDPRAAEGAAPANPIHPPPVEFSDEQIKQDHILQFFHYAHLPETLQNISFPFCNMAQSIVDHLPRNPERTAALRKLLEAKDCAVRAFVAK
jgi:hypothetical protein